jgi:hypothetical protein
MAEHRIGSKRVGRHNRHPARRRVQDELTDFSERVSSMQPATRGARRTGRDGAEGGAPASRQQSRIEDTGRVPNPFVATTEELEQRRLGRRQRACNGRGRGHRVARAPSLTPHGNSPLHVHTRWGGLQRPI